MGTPPLSIFTFPGEVPVTSLWFESASLRDVPPPKRRPASHSWTTLTSPLDSRSRGPLSPEHWPCTVMQAVIRVPPSTKSWLPSRTAGNLSSLEAQSTCSFISPSPRDPAHRLAPHGPIPPPRRPFPRSPGLWLHSQLFLLPRTLF